MIKLKIDRVIDDKKLCDYQPEPLTFELFKQIINDARRVTMPCGKGKKGYGSKGTKGGKGGKGKKK